MKSTENHFMPDNSPQHPKWNTCSGLLLPQMRIQRLQQNFSFMSIAIRTKTCHYIHIIYSLKRKVTKAAFKDFLKVMLYLILFCLTCS